MIFQETQLTWFPNNRINFITHISNLSNTWQVKDTCSYYLYKFIVNTTIITTYAKDISKCKETLFLKLIQSPI